MGVGDSMTGTELVCSVCGRGFPAPEPEPGGLARCPYCRALFRVSTSPSPGSSQARPAMRPAESVLRPESRSAPKRPQVRVLEAAIVLLAVAAVAVGVLMAWPDKPEQDTRAGPTAPVPPGAGVVSDDEPGAPVPAAR